jgi:ligand-binding sensor domain-containing protein
LKDGKLTNYTTKDGLSYNIVYTIFEDEDKTLWVGTYGGGLNRFKDGRFVVFTTKQGLFDNTVFQIIEDNQKNFWLTWDIPSKQKRVGRLCQWKNPDSPLCGIWNG